MSGNNFLKLSKENDKTFVRVTTCRIISVAIAKSVNK